MPGGSGLLCEWGGGRANATFEAPPQSCVPRGPGKCASSAPTSAPLPRLGGLPLLPGHALSLPTPLASASSGDSVSLRAPSHWPALCCPPEPKTVPSG